MYKRFVSALYLLNIIFQSFLNLLTPIGLGLLISYLLTEHAGAPAFVWAILTVSGVFAGLVSMVKFILSATSALDRLEGEQKARADAARTKQTPLKAANTENETPSEKGKQKHNISKFMGCSKSSSKRVHTGKYAPQK